jgi:exopolysaccharide biosynthesis polyprenyl glycosylphosphotransferase
MSNHAPILGVTSSYQEISGRSLGYLVKRAADLLVSLMALIILSPLFLLITLLIRVSSPGPAFFVQERIGYRGRRINIIKFRTMVVNAEFLKEGLQSLNEVDGPVFKIKRDPRITAIGGLLRKTSLDELPQLFNVLSGQMSLVGPRPLPTREALQCTGWQARRQEMKPGLTCLWQISGRNSLSFDEWMKLDLQYIDNWSLWLDLKIILQTIPEVIAARGM